MQSVLDEMQAVLADSGRSMRELSTDTKEEQREWWRARCGASPGEIWGVGWERVGCLCRGLASSSTTAAVHVP